MAEGQTECREAFEKWAKGIGCDLERDGNLYAEPDTHYLWQGWRAAWNRTESGMVKVPFQSRVKPWMDACFGPTISGDRVERNYRFLEEALELVQATGCSREDCLQLVDYVYGRPSGEPSQEVGGVMVTLAALCLANALDMHEAGEVELARVWTKIDVIRAKQAAKPRGSALPISPSYEAKRKDASPAECSTCGGSAIVDLSGFGDFGVCEDCPGAAMQEAV